MKRFVLFFILLSCIFCVNAQIATQAVHDKISATLFKEYKAKNYKEIYKLLDKEYQKQITEKEFADFFQFNIYEPYGEMNNLNFTEFKKDHFLYLADFKNGKLDLYLSCNLNEKITGMQWLPHKEILPELPELKSNKIISDNPKATAWDLKIDSIVTVYMRNPANCGLSIAIYNTKDIKFYNYGETKKGRHTLPSATTIYEIGSISKTFTGILFAKAILDKKVTANDPVKKHLGEAYSNLVYKDKNIELIHLANHSSRIHRIPYNLTASPGFDQLNPYANYNKAMVLKYVSEIKPDTFPGVKNEYSNLGMGLLGIILEQVYGKSYEELMSEYICRPLQMNDTKLNLSEEQTDRFATPYTQEGVETVHWDLGALPGAGGIRSTAADMIKFVQANIEESIPAFKLSHNSTFNDGNNNIALAWHLFTTRKSNEMIWHNGRTGGFAGFCGFIKSKNVGVVVLSNSGNPCDQVALGILKLLQ